MRNRTLKLGLVAATALSAALPLLATQSAYADYAPSSGDIVGVGSDTLQNMLDFVADGNAYGPTGYNQIGNKDKLVSFDATADANVRLAYGVDGGQTGQSICSPGTGSVNGTANSSSYPNATFPTSGAPCVLNPTIVLRAGLQPVQRPNGSGAGIGALEQDVAAGNNTYGVNEVINFSRASAAQHPPPSAGLDSVTAATDTLPMIASSTPATHAIPLDVAELWDVYQANTTGTNVFGGTGCVTWNEIPGNSAGSTDAIIPVIPQVGSGTRKYFLQQIQDTSGTPANPGTCASVSEENDPTAIAQQTTPADAIEPVAEGRLDLFQGENSLGANQGIGGYFVDPSCPYETPSANCGTGTLTPESTTVAAGSNGANVATLTTLNVASTTGFPASGNSLTVATSAGNANLAYTGTTATSLTGVSLNGGSGTVATNGAVSLVINSYVPNSVTPAVANVAAASTTVAASEVGVNVNTFTGTQALSVASTTGFASSGTVSVLVTTTGTTTAYANLTYTGKTATSLTGVNDQSATSGTLASGAVVSEGFDPSRNLYIYFRAADIAGTTPWQPGTSVNWLNALLYDPCPQGANNCVTINGVTYGPAGVPYIDTAAAVTLLQDAGVTPVNTDAAGNFQSGGA